MTRRVLFTAENPDDATRVSELLRTAGFEPVERSTMRLALRVSDQFNLSPRETEILFDLLEGKNNEAIGRKRGIKPSTVQWHRGNIFQRTQTDNLAELILLAYKDETC